MPAGAAESSQSAETGTAAHAFPPSAVRSNSHESTHAGASVPVSLTVEAPLLAASKRPSAVGVVYTEISAVESLSPPGPYAVIM